jgi:GNAT superfamily N-acetyltransferase
MLRIRPAEDSEVAEVAQVWQKGWHDAHVGHVPEALLAARTEEYFAETADALIGSTLVAVDDEAPEVLLGVVLVDGDELFQLAVAAEASGRGVGQALVTAAEELIAKNHDRAVRLSRRGGADERRTYAETAQMKLRRFHLRRLEGVWAFI